MLAGVAHPHLYQMAPSRDLDGAGISQQHYGFEPLATTAHAIARKHIEAAMDHISEPINPDLGLFSNIGDMLCNIVSDVAGLADELVTGEHIGVYSTLRVQEAERMNDLCDFRKFDEDTRRYNQLMDMRQVIAVTSDSLKREWQQQPGSVVGDTQPMRHHIVGLDQDRFIAASSASPRSRSTSQDTSIEGSTFPPLQPTPSTFNPQANAMTDHILSQALTGPSRPVAAPSGPVPLPGQLAMRGKGHYICPFGMKCDKGGFKDGKVVVFVRNCVFRSHLNKHSKPFRCDVPGCQNKTGFARPDQLARHIQMVKHGAG